MFGWTEYEVFGHPLPVIPPAGALVFTRFFTRVRKQGMVMQESVRCQRQDGELLEVEISAIPLIDQQGEMLGLLAIFADVTRRKREEVEYRHINHVLSLVSATKKAMFRAVREDELLQGVCRTLIDVGGYGLAWIGLITDERRRTIRLASWEKSDHQSRIDSPFRDGEALSATDPIATALRTGTAFVASDLTMTGNEAPWLANAFNSGFGSLVAVPLLSGPRAIGVLVISAHRTDAFTAVEVDLLVEIADDLAYGIESLRARLQWQRAQDKLLDTARQWRSTFDAIADPICVVDGAGNVARCNRAASRQFGKRFDEILGRPLVALMQGPGISVDDRLLAGVAANGKTEDEITAYGDRLFKITVNPIFDEQQGYCGAIHVMEDITEFQLADQQSKQNFKRLESIIDDSISAIMKITEMRDPYTAGHELRVSQLACAIAQEMGLREERVEGIRVAGRLHDIGKLYVPSEMLGKSGRLSEVEFNIIKAHPQAGYEILSTVDFPWPIASIVLQHHERLNGSGYPNGLSSHEIVLDARILAVADVVESMASHRPYRPARGIQKALQEVEDGMGTLFDPDVVAACLRLFHEHRFTFETRS